MRSAKLNGASVPDSAINDAVDYLKRHQDAERGCFGYTNRDDHNRSLTGMGLLCLELSGKHGSRETIMAADFVKNPDLSARRNGGRGGELKS